MAEGKVNGTKLEKIPISFQLGENVIDGAVVRPMTFQAFSNIVTEAQGMKEPEAWLARMRRVRMAKQVQYYINGTVMPVGILDIPKLSIIDARSIIAKLDADEAPAGKIVRDGDGMDKAITYELGTPIPTGAGKPPITELEFHASTYGDVEDIMAADNGVLQTVMMIKKLGKPLGTSLTALPSWAIDVITISDGVFIMNEILPRFLGSPDE
jgi:hypothetical protein